MTAQTRPHIVAAACQLRSGRDVRLLRSVFGVSTRGVSQLADVAEESLRGWEYSPGIAEPARRALWRAFARLARDRRRYAAQDCLDAQDLQDLDIGVAIACLLAGE